MNELPEDPLAQHIRKKGLERSLSQALAALSQAVGYADSLCLEQISIELAMQYERLQLFLSDSENQDDHS